LGFDVNTKESPFVRLSALCKGVCIFTHQIKPSFSKNLKSSDCDSCGAELPERVQDDDDEEQVGIDDGGLNPGFGEPPISIGCEDRISEEDVMQEEHHDGDGAMEGAVSGSNCVGGEAEFHGTFPTRFFLRGGTLRTGKLVSEDGSTAPVKEALSNSATGVRCVGRVTTDSCGSPQLPQSQTKLLLGSEAAASVKPRGINVKMAQVQKSRILRHNS
jgi:hypothetical protein